MEVLIDEGSTSSIPQTSLPRMNCTGSSLRQNEQEETGTEEPFFSTQSIFLTLESCPSCILVNLMIKYFYNALTSFVFVIFQLPGDLDYGQDGILERMAIINKHLRSLA
ncbi:hypothetical protein Droror1_Dr00008991 [Drosera rotundifolia]